VAQTIGDPVLPNPKEYECLYNVRIDRILGSNNKDFELVSSDEKSKSNMAIMVISELETVLNFYKTIKNHNDLLDLCIKEGTYFWNNLFHYLALKKDTIRVAQYTKFYGDVYKGDKRRQWFEDEINKILLESKVAPIKFEAE
jgi:hypothetical protein